MTWKIKTLFASLAAALLLASNCCAISYLDWPTARKKSWNISTLSSSKLHKLVTFSLPSPLAEGEDVSVDGDGNVYLWYNLGRGKSAAMYKINKSDLNLPKNETQKAAEEKAQKQKENTTESDDSKKSDDSSKTDDSNQSASDNSDKSDKSDDSAIPDAEKPKTAILKTDSVMGLLDLIVEIMRIGVPILGALGIVLFGLQYLTAGGDEAKVRKAKRRMLEVVIGLVAYAVASALFVWLGV